MLRSPRVIRIAAVGTIVISALLLVRALPLADWQSQFSQWLKGLGLWGPVAFCLVYILATLLMIPGSLITLAGGAVFGLLKGFLIVSVASTIGAGLAFLIARYLARPYVEQIAKDRPRFAAIDAAIRDGGWKIVALLRLSPAIPFNLQNYLYGLTDIRFGPYLLASWIAMWPGTFLYVYLGHVAGLAALENRERSPGEWMLLVGGLIATVVVSVYLTKLARKRLKKLPVNPQSKQGSDANEETSGEKPDARVTWLLVGVALLMFLAAMWTLFL